MSLEIERRFLLLPENIPASVLASPSTAIRQGYLLSGATDDELRVRQKGEHFFMTLKRGTGLVRSETEVEITESQFDLLWKETEGSRIEKLRHKHPSGSNTFEIDIYSGPFGGLCSAEVEFASEEEAAAFEPPNWFGTEVTEDSRLKNSALARNGLTDELVQEYSKELSFSLEQD